MDDNKLFVGLGGAGKTIFKKMMPHAIYEPEKPVCIVVDCSDIKDNVVDSYDKCMEEKINE